MCLEERQWIQDDGDVIVCYVRKVDAIDLHESWFGGINKKKPHGSKWKHR